MSRRKLSMIKMPDKKGIFPEETELSEIVLDKTSHAFEMIRQEDTYFMEKTNIKTNIKVRKFFKQAVAIAGVCILVLSSISAVAAIHRYWSRGMSGNIQASDTKQYELIESGVAKVYREDTDYASLAVTNNGVTIAPDTVIVDDRFAYMSFCISGYSIEGGEEPGLDYVNVYQGDDPQAETASLNMSASMYDGVIPDINGQPVYEDGSPLEYNEDRSTVNHYMDSDGNMEYIIQAGIVDINDSLLGKTIHVDMKNLGSYSNSMVSGHQKGEFVTAVEGDWNFEIMLPDVSSAKDISVGQKVEGTDFILENINISPISMKVDYSVNEAPEIKEDELGIPEVKGVVLKDGTRLPYLTGGSRTGYTDGSRTHAYQIAGFARVIDAEDVAALIVLTSSYGENKKVEIPIS